MQVFWSGWPVDDGCLVHWLALLGIGVSMAYLALRLSGTRPRVKGEGRRLVGWDGCFFVLLAGVSALLYLHRRCGLDGGLLALWLAVLAVELGVLSGRRERRWPLCQRGDFT